MKQQKAGHWVKIVEVKFPSYINIVLSILFIFSLNIYAQQDNFPVTINNNPDVLKSQLQLLSNPLVFKSLVMGNYIENRDTTLPHDTASVQDTLPFPEETKPKLLPDRMSFMERFLWDENGFFRKTGIASPLTPESRERELKVRRTMLTSHLLGGITTELLMLATCYYGQKVIDTRSRSARDAHQTLVTATIIDYSLTGLLAVLSPPPLIRREEESTITIHKTLAWLHFAGMVATPILGNMIGGRRRFNTSKAHVHQVAAYATTAIFTAAMVVITF